MPRGVVFVVSKTATTRTASEAAEARAATTPPSTLGRTSPSQGADTSSLGRTREASSGSLTVLAVCGTPLTEPLTPTVQRRMMRPEMAPSTRRRLSRRAWTLPMFLSMTAWTSPGSSGPDTVVALFMPVTLPHTPPPFFGAASASLAASSRPPRGRVSGGTEALGRTTLADRTDLSGARSSSSTARSARDLAAESPGGRTPIQAASGSFRPPSRTPFSKAWRRWAQRAGRVAPEGGPRRWGS